MFRLNLKIALRNLWKNKGYTLINAGGLAIGLASCMILLLYVAYEWSYDKQFKDYNKTYVVYNNTTLPNEIFSFGWTPGVMAPEIREKITGIALASRSTYPELSLISRGENSFKKQAVYADPDFLKILNYKFIKGNPDKVLKENNTVILTEQMARQLFGDEDPINKMVKLENTDFLKVEAVIAAIPGNNSIRFDYLMPWSLYENRNQWIKDAGWGSNYCLTLVQLSNPQLFGKVSEQIKDIYKRHEKGITAEAIIHPLSKWHLYNRFENGKSVGGRIDQIKIFIGVALCILLIACVNFMNLSTARSQKRAKEVGVRKAIGSSRKALIGQFMVESVLLSCIGMLCAFVLMELSLPYFNRLLDIELAINYSDWQFWLALTGLTLITGFIAGSYPAFYLSSFEPVKVLKGFSAAGGSSVSVRKVLVVFQFVFAICLIVFTVVIYQQLNYIKEKPIGYERAGLLEIPIQGTLRNPERLKTLKEQMIKSGAATGITYFSSSLGRDEHKTFDINWPGKNKKDGLLFYYRSAGYDFVKTIGSRLLAGREFMPQYNDSAKVIVNEAAVKAMGLKDPVGVSISWGPQRATIIGVIKDFVVASPYQKALPMVIYNEDINLNVALIRLNPAMNVSSSVDKIDALIKEFNPGFPMERSFADADFEAKFKNEQLLGTLSNWFGGFAIFISCLGLLGLTLYMAEQRKKEISIRKVLGASTIDVLTLLNKDFIKLVGIANLIAFPLAYIMITKWLSGYDFRISISIIPFAAAVILSLLIAVLTISLQSAKVVKSNPIDALKYE